MKVLIDADIVCYRCAAANEKADFPIAKWQADQLISRIIEETNASDWELFMTGGNNNFRYQVYPEYKANRLNVPKPRHLEGLREHLVLDWNANLVDGYEADDAMGINMGASEQGIICASIDKDLLQIPGTHYNFVNRQFTVVTRSDGMRTFFRQLLIGDPTDNIKGCSGIGPVKADRIIGNYGSLEELYGAVAKTFDEVYLKDGFKQLDLNAQLIYIWRQENDNWQRLLLPPTATPKQEVEVTSSSLPMTETTSMESTKVPTMNGSPTDGGLTDTVGP